MLEGKRIRTYRIRATVKTLDGGSSSSAPLPPPPAWIELPEDLTANILHRLGAEEILESAQKVCTTWWRVCKHPALWRVIDMSDLRGLFTTPTFELYEFKMRRLKIMCHHAVDRSQGQLIDISLQSFDAIEMLSYISQRFNCLKRLSLLTCEVVGEAFEKFPELEELNLVCTPVHPKDIEIIGTSCPKLKSFSYMHQFFPRLAGGHNDWALAVAKSMPNLHHLNLFRDNVESEGLAAILDSCPHLESLDICCCYGVDLRGNLGKRCSQQMKDLIRPYDSLVDYRWRDLIWHDYDYDYDDGFAFEDHRPS